MTFTPSIPLKPKTKMTQNFSKKTPLLYVLGWYLIVLISSLGLLLIAIVAAQMLAFSSLVGGMNELTSQVISWTAVFFFFSPLLVFAWAGRKIYIKTQVRYHSKKLRLTILWIFILSSLIPIIAYHGYNRLGEYLENRRVEGYNIRYYDKEKKYKEFEEWYTNGVKDGEQKYYWKNGRIREIVHFVNGIQEGERLWFAEEGYLRRKENYTNGKLNGEAQELNPDGSINCKRNYKNGKRDGLKQCFSNGQIYEEEEYKDDYQHGLTKLYSEGYLDSEITYNMGEFVKRRYYNEKGELIREIIRDHNNQLITTFEATSSATFSP